MSTNERLILGRERFGERADEHSTNGSLVE